MFKTTGQSSIVLVCDSFSRCRRHKMSPLPKIVLFYLKISGCSYKGSMFVCFINTLRESVTRRYLALLWILVTIDVFSITSEWGGALWPLAIIVVQEIYSLSFCIIIVSFRLGAAHEDWLSKFSLCTSGNLTKDVMFFEAYNLWSSGCGTITCISWYCENMSTTFLSCSSCRLRDLRAYTQVKWPT